MPFKKTKTGSYKSPSGRKMTGKQVKAYKAKTSSSKSGGYKRTAKKKRSR